MWWILPNYYSQTMYLLIWLQSPHLSNSSLAMWSCLDTFSLLYLTVEDILTVAPGTLWSPLSACPDAPSSNPNNLSHQCGSKAFPTASYLILAQGVQRRTFSRTLWEMEQLAQGVQKGWRAEMRSQGLFTKHPPWPHQHPEIVLRVRVRQCRGSFNNSENGSCLRIAWLKLFSFMMVKKQEAFHRNHTPNLGLFSGQPCVVPPSLVSGVYKPVTVKGTMCTL